MTLYAQDTFVDVDETPIVSHTPDSGFGSWVEWTPGAGSGNWKIKTNHLRANSGGEWIRCGSDVIGDDFEVDGDVTRASNNFATQPERCNLRSSIPGGLTNGDSFSPQIMVSLLATDHSVASLIISEVESSGTTHNFTVATGLAWAESGGALRIGFTKKGLLVRPYTEPAGGGTRTYYSDVTLVEQHLSDKRFGFNSEGAFSNAVNLDNFTVRSIALPPVTPPTPPIRAPRSGEVLSSLSLQLPIPTRQYSDRDQGELRRMIERAFKQLAAGVQATDAAANSVPWSKVTSTPTTLGGYGITDLTTRGDLLTRGASAYARLAIGSSGKYLRSDGTDPSWQTLGFADLTYTGLTSGNFLKATGTTTAAFTAIAASDVQSGTFADARIAQSNVTQHQAALSIAASQLTAGTFGGSTSYTFPSFIVTAGALAGVVYDDRGNNSNQWVTYVNSGVFGIFSVPAGGDLFRVAASGSTFLTHLLFSADNTFDIGASGATRPRDLFLGRNAAIGGTLTMSDKILTVASSTSRAGLNMPSGTAPTSPGSGDFWYDGSALKFQDGGTTRTITWT